MSELPANAGAPTRSSFVTVVAWTFIVMSFCATLLAIVQNIAVAAVYSDPNFLPPAGAVTDPEMPGFALFLVNNMRWIVLAGLLVCLATLAASIGLLKRMDWGRWLFIAMLALGIAWNLGVFGLLFWAFSSAPANLPGQEELMAQFRAFRIVMLALSGLWALGITALFAWIINKLLSPAIAREFAAAASA